MRYLLLILSLLFGAAHAATTVNGTGQGITDPAAFRTAVFSGSNVSNTEFGYLDGLTGGIQTQIDAKVDQGDFDDGLALKAPLANPTFTGTVTIPDGSLAIADVNGLSASLDAKATTTAAVWVTFANGTRTPYAPASDTNDARGTAFETAHAAALAASGAEAIDLYPATFNITITPSTIAGISAHLGMDDGLIIRLNGATITHGSAHNAAAIFSADAKNDWSLLGPGVIQGTGSASTTPPSGANEIGINFRSGRRFRISDIVFRYFKNHGAQANSSSYSGHGTTINSDLKISTGHIHNCNFDYNNVGAGAYQASEFITWTNCTYNNNAQGTIFTAGNNKFIGCDANGNTTDGVRINNNSTQDGHGCWIGGHIVHNVSRAIYAESSMDLGFQFVGVTIGSDSATSNQIISLGSGVNFVGCYIDAPFYAASTPTGLNTVTGCFFPKVSVSAAQAVADLSAAERLMWCFDDSNKTKTAGYENNDTIIYRFADDAAAATGGIVAGRKYTDSDTNGVCIKQ